MPSGRTQHAEVLVPLTTSLKVRKESRSILIKPSFNNKNIEIISYTVVDKEHGDIPVHLDI